MIPRTLADFVGESRRSGDQLNYEVCPVCGSRGWNVYIDPKTGKWICFAKNHDRGGVIDVADWSEEGRLASLQNLTYPDEHVDHYWPEVQMPYVRDLSAMALRYLDRRGICAEWARRLGMREMMSESRIVIPYFGEHQRIIHWVGREYIDSRVSKTHPKYKAAYGAKPMYMLPAWKQVDHAVLVEGPLDAIAVQRHTGIPAISIGGTSMSARVAHDVRELVTDRVTIMLDGDAVSKALLLSDQLSDRYRPRVVCLVDDEDPASLDPKTLRSLL